MDQMSLVSDHDACMQDCQCTELCCVQLLLCRMQAVAMTSTKPSTVWLDQQGQGTLKDGVECIENGEALPDAQTRLAAGW